jgi:hypothetical protein
MTQQDLDFLEKNIINFESVRLGFCRNIDAPTLNEYASIYQRTLDSNFHLNAWCGNCVFDMIKRLEAHYMGLKYIQKLSAKNQTKDAE